MAMNLLAGEQIYLERLLLRGLQEKTIKAVKVILNDLFESLYRQGIADLVKVKKTMLKEYLEERYYYINRYGKQNGIRVRNKEISTVKDFFSSLYDLEYLKDDPARKLGRIREPSLCLPKDILTKAELLKLFRLPDVKSKLGYRDRVILEVLYSTGIRRAELCSLKVEDINYIEGTVFISKGKGGKDRVVPIGKKALSFVKHYVKNIRPGLVKHKNIANLILSYTGRFVVPKNLNDMLKKYIKTINKNKEITIHSLRHTYATHLLQKGMKLRYVQELLGHENMNTTIRYLHLNIKDLQTEYRKCHPREKDYIK
jgi:integrase/recombinase XerD